MIMHVHMYVQMDIQGISVKLRHHVLPMVLVQHQSLSVERQLLEWITVAMPVQRQAELVLLMEYVTLRWIMQDFLQCLVLQQLHHTTSKQVFLMESTEHMENLDGPISKWEVH